MTQHFIAAGVQVLVEENILIRARLANSELSRLLAICAAEEIKNAMTNFVVAEFGHRLMKQNAKNRGLSGPNCAKALPQHRALVQ